MWGLGSIGNALGKIGSGIKTGAQGIGRGVQKFRSWQDEMAEDEDGASGGAQGGILGAIGLPAGNGQRKQVITPGFAGNRGVPTFDLGRMSQMAGAQQPARQPLQPAAMPQQPNAPLTVEPVTLPTRIQSMPNRPDGAMNLPDVPGSPTPVPRGGLPGNDPNANVENVQIPGLPNRGPSVPYSPYDFERFNDVMQGAKRGPDGNFLGKEQGGGFKRDLKTTLLSGLAGAQRNAGGGNLAQMLGGFIGGGINGVANPQAAREDVFDAGRGREMMAQQGRQDTETERQRKLEAGQLGVDNIRSQIEGRRAQAETARINADRQQRVAESTIQYNQARTEAAKRGTPVKVDLYNPDKDQVESVQIYPDGKRVVLGISGDSVIKGATLEAQNARAEADRALKREIAQMPARPRSGGASRTGGGEGIPTEARQQHTRVQSLKQKADAAWAKAKNPGPSDNAASLLEIAQAAQADYNANAQDLADAYGDYYEVGNQGSRTPGDPGWAYIKPKALPSGGAPSSSSGQPRATVAADFVERVMKQLGVDRTTALQRIQNSGIQVQ